jgi:predicted nucleic acid-binding protein
VAAPDVVPTVCRDESDDAIFAAAKAAGADYLVAGDQDLQSLRKRRPKIRTPAAFLQEIL